MKSVRLGISAFLLTGILISCSSDDEDLSQTSASVARLIEASEEVDVSTDSVDGDWLVVTEKTETFSQTIMNDGVEISRSRNADYSILNIVKLASNGTTLTIEKCLGEVTQYTVSEDGNSFSIDVSQDSDLVDFRSVEENINVSISNNRLMTANFESTFSLDCSIEEGSDGTIGANDEGGEVCDFVLTENDSEQVELSMYKISDEHIASIGILTRGEISRQIDPTCFHYEESLGTGALTREEETPSITFSNKIAEIVDVQGNILEHSEFILDDGRSEISANFNDEELGLYSALYNDLLIFQDDEVQTQGDLNLESSVNSHYTIYNGDFSITDREDSEKSIIGNYSINLSGYF